MKLAKLPPLAAIAVTGISYVLLGHLSLLIGIPARNAAGLWPAAGFAVASCLVHGLRVWPAILIGALIVLAGTPAGTVTALLIAAGNTVEAVLTAWLIERYTKAMQGFSCGEDVFRLIVFAFAGALLASLNGSASLLAGGNIGAEEYRSTLIMWLLGDLTGVTIIVPAILASLALPSPQRNGRQRAELALFAILFGICGIVVFTLSTTPLLFLFLPLIAWLAFRFTPGEVATANLVLAAFAVGALHSGTGPLAPLGSDSALLTLQIFVGVVGVASLVLAATVEGRRRVELHLQKMRDDLAWLVSHRTSLLENTNKALRHDIAIRIEAQQQLLSKERLLEEAQRLAHLGSWEWDVANDRLTMSPEMMRIYGVPPEERDSMNYKKYLQYIPPDERRLVDSTVRNALTTRHPFAYVHHALRPDGTVRYMHCGGALEVDAAGNPVRLYGTAHDRTEEKALEENLREAEELYRKLVELSPDAIYLLREGRYTFSNASGLKLVGAAATRDVYGRPLLDFIPADSRRDVAEALRRLSRSEDIVSAEAKISRLDGVVIDIELTATPFSIKNAQHTLLVARNISERKKAEQQIHHLAHHDTLTGLANRTLFEQSLAHAISQSHRSGRPLAVLFIDLDRFKSVNDTSGHGAGDRVLRECAQRMRECLRDSDVIARAGGDEFLILIEAISDPLHVPAIARKLIAVLGQPFHAAGKEFAIGASVGISTCPADGEDVETLIKHADIAMYRAKTEGAAHYRYYSPSMTRRSLERYALEAALRHALERGEMELYFQPKISLLTGRISGAEALIRWNHPQEGLLLPYRFVSIAEDIGLIAEMGLWAIAEVCRCSRDWQQQGLPEVRIAVNLAYSQFSDTAFYSKLNRLLEEFGVSPGILELEMTETMAMENAERLMSTLQQLKQLGIRLSVDDFGTGYSSLAYLKRLPVDSVKVDRSFIKDLPHDNEDVAITHAVLALVHSLKRSVVAEGVETKEQLRFLVANQCDEVQGFYFSPALPEQEFRRFLAEERSFLDESIDAAI
jgi:diguanylate cyclase (GGDEF)-like protein/PAS domain S-box-containing protein